MNTAKTKRRKRTTITSSSISQNAPWSFMCVYSEARKANERESRVFFFVKAKKERRKRDEKTSKF